LRLIDFLGIKPKASQDQVQDAYKKKGRLLHPDKARREFTKTWVPKPGSAQTKPSEREIKKATEAATKRFGRLGVVKEVLKGPGRARYDHFLNNGFPIWRGTGFYYNRYRPGIGSVLAMLFVFAGGAVHYGALYVGWRRHREFVDRYIREARRIAWGDEAGIKGIPPVGVPSLDGTATPVDDTEDSSAGMTRKQRRAQEKAEKKPKSKASRYAPKVVEEGEENKGPQAERRKVTAANGKVLIVDTIGNVWLLEQDEEGNDREQLIDVSYLTEPVLLVINDTN
jgi:curved DNA-binding protein CbpA